MSKELRPSKLWSVGDRITMLDAWMMNPIEGKIVAIPNEFHVVMDDARGVRHYGRTDRIVGDPVEDHDFDDLLGGAPVNQYAFADLLG